VNVIHQPNSGWPGQPRNAGFAPTAPGPLLSRTTEVAEALLDLGSVVSKDATARELFNKEFNRLHDGHAAERVIDAFF
jgi:CDP-glycerol glycerophosphotransferase